MMLQPIDSRSLLIQRGWVPASMTTMAPLYFFIDSILLSIDLLCLTLVPYSSFSVIKNKKLFEV